ncbi:MAG: GerMN domain-containing protein [Waterburya sp.]
MKVRNKSPDFTPTVIGLSLLLIGLAQVTTIWTIKKAIIPTVNELTSIEVQPAKFSPQLYWLKIVDNRIQLASRSTHTTATSSEQALKDAFTQLLARPNNFDLVTTIPRQTRLLNLHTTENGIYVNLSQEFTQGGGSSSMIYRVAQVLYTATSIDPQVPVFISIAGQPLNQNYPLGGEGLLLDYPLTRQQFAQEFLAE